MIDAIFEPESSESLKHLKRIVCDNGRLMIVFDLAAPLTSAIPFGQETQQALALLKTRGLTVEREPHSWDLEDRLTTTLPAEGAERILAEIIGALAHEGYLSSQQALEAFKAFELETTRASSSVISANRTQ